MRRAVGSCQCLGGLSSEQRNAKVPCADARYSPDHRARSRRRSRSRSLNKEIEHEHEHEHEHESESESESDPN